MAEPNPAAAPADPLFAQSARKTMFPSLDGTSPGDTTLAPTAAMVPDAEPEGSLSSVPNAQVEGAPAPAGPPDPIDIEVPPATAPRKRTAQDRIDQLTRRYRETQEQNSGLQSQIQSLTEMVQRLSTSQSQPRPVAAPPADDLSVLLGGSQSALPPAGTSAPPAPVADIPGIVHQAISAYDQQRQIAEQRGLQLRQAHEEAFSAAVEEMPELADGRTNARKIFNQVFATSPLRVLPDGPYQVALQVRGILASEAARAPGSQTVDSRKAQAGALAPAPINNGVPGELSRTKLTKEYEDLMARRRQGDNSFGTFNQLRRVRDALRTTR